MKTIRRLIRRLRLALTPLGKGPEREILGGGS